MFSNYKTPIREYLLHPKTLNKVNIKNLFYSLKKIKSLKYL